MAGAVRVEVDESGEPRGVVPASLAAAVAEQHCNSCGVPIIEYDDAVASGGRWFHRSCLDVVRPVGVSLLGGIPLAVMSDGSVYEFGVSGTSGEYAWEELTPLPRSQRSRRRP